jgi:hypothetical protein
MSSLRAKRWARRVAAVVDSSAGVERGSNFPARGVVRSAPERADPNIAMQINSELLLRNLQITIALNAFSNCTGKSKFTLLISGLILRNLVFQYR